jgi:hypothetical protein
MMTVAQAKFVELEKQKETVKKYFDDLQNALEAVVDEIGVDCYFQDEAGTVYKTVIPDGRFVKFEKLSYERTKRPGEARGTLSVKEAKEAGFTVD